MALEVKGKVALLCPAVIVTVAGTVSGDCALRDTAVAALAGAFRETVQVPDPPLAIDVGEQVRDVN